MDSLYCTAFHIVGSFYDVEIELSKVEPVLDETGNVTGNQRIPKQRITLPVPLAKELAQKLSETLENYEKTFGEIHLPPVQIEKE